MKKSKKPKAQEKYVSLERAAAALRLTSDQLKQYLITGQLLASIIYHKPENYRDTTPFVDNDGIEKIHTRTVTTALRCVSADHQYAPLMYLHHEDTTRVLLNKVANREMLVGRLFHDNTISPKTGLGLIGDSAIVVAIDDLVIDAEELGRFANAAGIRIPRGPANSIALPRKPVDWGRLKIGGLIVGSLSVIASIATIAVIFG